MRKSYWVAFVAALAFFVVLALRPWATSGSPTDSAEAPDAPIVREGPTVPSPPGEHERDSAPKVTKKKRKVGTAERERYRRAIREGIAGRDRANAPPPPSNDDLSSSHDVGSARGGDGLIDRSDGKLARLAKDLQDDVMPLANECYEQALERDPTIAGGLGLQFAIIGDEDVGGLVESVDLEDDSDIQDAEMLECMRETLLSTIFPAPDDSGETGVRLTLEFSPDEG
ncbi:MAG: AgmX/PglI C-terminal domain-containing protein [Nannocystaceae bacterium]|nr:AgmX/PglI C-terminal domain-containing protein [bacterium]